MAKIRMLLVGGVVICRRACTVPYLYPPLIHRLGSSQRGSREPAHRIPWITHGPTTVLSRKTTRGTARPRWRPQCTRLCDPLPRAACMGAGHDMPGSIVVLAMRDASSIFKFSTVWASRAACSVRDSTGTRIFSTLQARGRRHRLEGRYKEGSVNPSGSSVLSIFLLVLLLQ